MGVSSALEGKLRATAADAHSSVGCTFYEELLELAVVVLRFLGLGSLVWLGLIRRYYFIRL